MNYIPRPGIIRSSLCGMPVLIPSRIASDACKTILPLNFFGVAVWVGIEKDYELEQVLAPLRPFSRKSDEELAQQVERCCQKFCAAGFALPKEKHPDSAPAAEEAP